MLFDEKLKSYLLLRTMWAERNDSFINFLILIFSFENVRIVERLQK